MIGVLSDAHGNVSVFKRMLDTLSALGAESFVFLGDAVGYIPSVGVLESLIELRGQVQCILGNHEEMLLGGDYQPRLESIYRIQATKSLLSAEQASFVATWPRYLERDFPCGRALFVHGSPKDHQNGYVYPDTELADFDVPYEFIFMGHTHRAFVREHNNRRFINVGSCGLPRDDGRYASAVLFDPANGNTRLIRLDLSFFDAANYLVDKDVHASVAELFLRRQINVVGEIFESN
jgi:predicted phosphodiesterase